MRLKSCFVCQRCYICNSILGLYRDNGKDNETTIVFWGYTGIMEKWKLL